MTCEAVCYDYTNLESALELAAVRLPMKTFCSLLERVEYVISTRAQADSLENEIYHLLGHKVAEKPFTIQRLGTQGVAIAA